MNRQSKRRRKLFFSPIIFNNLKLEFFTSCRNQESNSHMRILGKIYCQLAYLWPQSPKKYTIPIATVSYWSAGSFVVSGISRDLSWNFWSFSVSWECHTLPPSSLEVMGVLGDGVEGDGVGVVGVKKGKFQVENQANVLSFALKKDNAMQCKGWNRTSNLAISWSFYDDFLRSYGKIYQTA